VPVPSFYIFTVGGLSVDIIKILSLWKLQPAREVTTKYYARFGFTCNVNSFSQEGESWTFTIWQRFPLKSCMLRHNLEDRTK